MTDENIEELVRNLANDDRGLRYEATQKLADLGVSAIPYLITALDDEQYDTSYLNDVFKQIGEPAIEPLIAALQDNSKMLHQQRAALALAIIGDERAIDPLMQALKDDDPEVRAEAASALGAFADADAVGALLVALDDPDNTVRAKAAWSLGNFGDIRSIERLLKAAEDADAGVRRGAIWSLAKLEAKQAYPIFEQALKDRDTEVRHLAAVALRKLGGDAPALERYTASSEELTEEIEQVLDSIQSNTRLSTGDMDMLRHSNPRIRARLLVALGEKGGRKSVEALLPALNDINPAVRNTAISSMVKLGTESVVSLIEALGHHSKYVREGAVQALARINDPRAFEPIVGLVDDEAEQVRHAVAEALGKFNDSRAIKPLRRLQADGDEDVRAAAERSLIKLGVDPSDVGGFFRNLIGRLRRGD